MPITGFEPVTLSTSTIRLCQLGYTGNTSTKTYNFCYFGITIQFHINSIHPEIICNYKRLSLFYDSANFKASQILSFIQCFTNKVIEFFYIHIFTFLVIQSDCWESNPDSAFTSIIPRK